MQDEVFKISKQFHVPGVSVFLETTNWQTGNGLFMICRSISFIIKSGINYNIKSSKLNKYNAKR